MASILYPGTFDPITNGHADIVRRAARMFERVVVAIAANPGKAPAFPLETRVRLAKEVLHDVKNLEVVGFTELTVEFARKHGLIAILRGLRAVSDFEFEFQMAAMNRHLGPEVETIFMTRRSSSPSSPPAWCGRSPSSAAMWRSSCIPRSRRN